jgi:hypothetical protein
MPILSKPSSLAHAALAYITIGSLTLIWSAVWYWWLVDTRYEGHAYRYICFGLLMTGLVLLVIGLVMGRIGRAARKAELPPHEVTPAVESADQKAAARGAVPGQPGAPAPPQNPALTGAQPGVPQVLVVPTPAPPAPGASAPRVQSAPSAPAAPPSPELQKVPPVE